MISRPLLFGSALLIAFAQLAFAEGDYQLTRKGRTLVWNNHPRSGDEATWAGRRDRDGYAQGFGTLVWYTKVRGFDEPVLYARYWGRMVRGKFEGAVNAHTKEKTLHAFFVDGARATRWSGGTARSSPTPNQQLALNAARQRVLVAARQRVQTASAPEPPVPAEGPLNKVEGRDQRSVIRGPQHSEIDNQLGPTTSAAIGQQEETRERIIESSSEVRSLGGDRPEIPGWPKIEADRSIKLLALPPRSLNLRR